METIRLHIGGKQRHPDWKILDIESRPEVDYLADASDLSQFADESVSVIYASHVLEHFHYALNRELLNTLAEWFRVLVPGGQVMISVPNLQVLCWLYCNPNLIPDERFHLMRMMFGGQVNEFDVHRVGFDPDILAFYLHEVGFTECKVVSEFGLFDDCSSLRVLDTLISLNMVARKQPK